LSRSKGEGRTASQTKRKRVTEEQFVAILTEPAEHRSIMSDPTTKATPSAAAPPSAEDNQSATARSTTPSGPGGSASYSAIEPVPY